MGVLVSVIKKGGPNGSRVAAMKFCCFHSFHHIPICWVSHSQVIANKNVKPSNCRCPSRHLRVPSTPSQSGCRCISVGQTSISGRTLAEKKKKPSLRLLQSLNNFGPWVSCQVEDGSGQRAQTMAIPSPISDHIQVGDFNWSTTLTWCHSRVVTGRPTDHQQAEQLHSKTANKELNQDAECFWQRYNEQQLRYGAVSRLGWLHLSASVPVDDAIALHCLFSAPCIPFAVDVKITGGTSKETDDNKRMSCPSLPSIFILEYIRKLFYWASPQAVVLSQLGEQEQELRLEQRLLKAGSDVKRCNQATVLPAPTTQNMHLTMR